MGSRTLHIEAKSAEQANQLAEQHGIYFDGVERGIDCDCCGDRWTRVTEPPLGCMSLEEIENLIDVLHGLVDEFGSERVTLSDILDVAAERRTEFLSI